jgi:hypothetical protein
MYNKYYLKLFFIPIFGLNFLGSIIDGITNIFTSERANQHSAAEASRNRSFQERMSRQRHEYEVADLRRAGLNPILSAHSGAAVPSGAQGQAFKADVRPSEIASALRVQREQSEVLRQQKKLTNAEYIKTKFESEKAFAEARASMLNTAKSMYSFDAFMKRPDIYGEIQALREATGDSTLSSARGIASGVGSFFKNKSR